MLLTGLQGISLALPWMLAVPRLLLGLLSAPQDDLGTSRVEGQASMSGAGSWGSHGARGACRQQPASHPKPHSRHHSPLGRHRGFLFVLGCVSSPPCPFLHAPRLCVCLAACHQHFSVAFSHPGGFFDVLWGYLFSSLCAPGSPLFAPSPLMFFLYRTASQSSPLVLSSL